VEYDDEDMSNLKLVSYNNNVESLSFKTMFQDHRIQRLIHFETAPRMRLLVINWRCTFNGINTYYMQLAIVNVFTLKAASLA
jgi:hypothetical protein